MLYKLSNRFDRLETICSKMPAKTELGVDFVHPGAEGDHVRPAIDWPGGYEYIEQPNTRSHPNRAVADGNMQFLRRKVKVQVKRKGREVPQLRRGPSCLLRAAEA